MKLTFRTSLGIVLGLVTAAGYGCYVYWTHTPYYALTQVATAYRTHDYPLLAHYVDFDTLVPRAVDTLVDTGLDTGKQESLASTITTGLVSFLKPQMATWVKASIQKAIETPYVQAADSGEGLSERLPASILGQDWSKAKLLNVIYDGKLAFAHVSLDDQAQNSKVLILKMRQALKGHWQVMEIANLGDLLLQADQSAKTSVGHARRIAATIQIRNIEGALQLYRLDNGVYPTTEQALKALVERPLMGPMPKKWKRGGYLHRLSEDPWGNAYQYVGPSDKGKYEVMSLAADGKVGGEGLNADITNWNLDEE